MPFTSHALHPSYPRRVTHPHFLNFFLPQHFVYSFKLCVKNRKRNKNGQAMQLKLIAANYDCKAR